MSEAKPYDIKKRAYLFSRAVIAFIESTRYKQIYTPLFDQLLRSGTSIGANLVEAGGGSSKKEVINYFHIALKSANETKYWLCLIRDSIDCDREANRELLNEADELSKIVATAILKMKGIKDS